MENLGEAVEAMKDDMNQLKDQIGQILEAFAALRSARESQIVRNEEATSSDPVVQQIGAIPTSKLDHTGWPPYGLPHNYRPPYEGQAEQEQPPPVVLVNPSGAPVNQTEAVQVQPNDGITGTNVEGPVVRTTAQPVVQPQIWHGISHDAEEAKSKLEFLEERLRAIEGGGSFGFGNAAGLCLVPDVVIPPKFKVPDFEKYKGASCPKNHLTMYCRKMAAHAGNEKLLIHFFQDSLAGTALSWYMHLEPTRIRTWNDLVDAFLKQYKYNVDMAPDRLQLQNMSKRNNETFKEYAQRWRELAAQVEPPLHDKEMVTMFMGTLQSPFYEHMVGSVSSNFADIVIIGERIELGLKTGKIAQGTTTSGKKTGFNSGKKKEGEGQVASTTAQWGGYPSARYRPERSHTSYTANAQSMYQQSAPPAVRPPSGPPNVYMPKQNWKNEGGQNANQPQGQNSFQRREQIQFTPLPMSYTELLPSLLQNALVAISPMKPPQPPYSKNYDPNAKCAYHGGVVGHSIENCRQFKYKVQQLLDAGWLTFQEDKPNVEKNPLSSHAGPSTNAILRDMGQSPVRRVEDIKSPLKDIFTLICHLGYFKPECKHGDMCEFHASQEHSIDECFEFKSFLQDLLDRHVLQVCHPDREEEVYTQTNEDPTSHGPKPLVLHVARNPMMLGERQPVVIQTPSPFPYKSDKAVPWKYGVSVLEGDSGTININKSTVDNISGIGGMTRSGRLFAPSELRNGRSLEKTSEGVTIEKAKAFLKGKAMQVDEEPEVKDNKEISDEAAGEFLRFIQQSEYKVIDQLNRMPARVSLLDLLMHSTSHRKLLMKILNGAHVERDISLNQFEGIVNHIRANDYLTFTEDEIPSEGRGHNKALHISVKCMDYVLARVLIDNGSSLNVMPKTTLDKIYCEGAHLRPSSMVVRAFDGSRREVIGEIELPIQVGPCTFQIVFQVMDILPAYSCLLGRPWIHSAGVVPSTLHQKLKFMFNDKLIIVSGEEDFLVSGPLPTPYIETAEEALETSFQALEIVGTMYVEPFKINPCLSKASVMVAKTMLKDGYKYGQALGKRGQGLLRPLKLPENKGRYGLGYKPTGAGKKEMFKGRKEEITLCDIGQTFRSAGWINTDQVAVIENAPAEGSQNLVRPCLPNAIITNWEFQDLPMVFASDKT